ncbi:MAG: hypothetical protein ACYDG2_17180 [Ruminiclostridium sp.]
MITIKTNSDHVKYNALKNSLYVPLGELMPCIRRCPFKELCHIYDTIYSDSKLSFAGRCPTECNQWLTLHEYFSNNKAYTSVDQTLINEYIDLTIATERMRKQVSLNPEIVAHGNNLSKPCEILSRLQKKFLQASEDILIALKGIIEGGCSHDGQVTGNDTQG